MNMDLSNRRQTDFPAKFGKKIPGSLEDAGPGQAALNLFAHLPHREACALITQLSARNVDAHETIVRQGERNGYCYVIERGTAALVHTDPITDEVIHVGSLGPGDVFGAQAILTEGTALATVTMTSAGALWQLPDDQFVAWLRPTLVHTLDAPTATTMVRGGTASFIDCRFEMEYSESRIPGARLIPLPLLRTQVDSLDRRMSYIVYCRSGKRSAAAAYLLREHHVVAFSLAGGINAWPYEIECASS